MTETQADALIGQLALLTDRLAGVEAQLTGISNGLGVTHTTVSASAYQLVTLLGPALAPLLIALAAWFFWSLWCLVRALLIRSQLWPKA